ncbi:MAG: copper chaperone Copz family protein [Gammaproteobacteria bacterium]|jgi:Zinc binding domain|nr:copper chaperone Copz family protein [Gammaproteobacteria bacterium]
MTDCCTTSCNKTNTPKNHTCPANGKPYTEVAARTIMHHIKNAWQWQNKDQRYFFCDDPACEVVYFGEDDSTILKSQLHTRIGIKESSMDALLCYCFGITKADAINNPRIKDYVINMTKAGICSCETSNPSGRCCLKNF